MKICVVHNHYKNYGGEDKVFEEEVKLLRKYNLEVVTYSITNEAINTDSIKSKIRTGINTLWAKENNKQFEDFLVENKPDLVHFHNTFPLISPSAYYVCSKLEIPVIQTLHNYRIGCPGALLMRDGVVCEKCIEGSLINSIKYKCYRDSRIQTSVLASMLSVHNLLGTWNKKVDKFIALTNFSKNKFIEMGINQNKIYVKPNSIEAQKSENRLNELVNNQLVFVGRISPEKGLENLLEALNHKSLQDYSLKVIGEGPLLEEYKKKYSSGKVEFLGKQSSQNVIDFISKSKFLVVPSIWYEGFPMTILESFSVGTPVIASEIGSLTEIIDDEYNGFKFSVNDNKSLINVINKAMNFNDYTILRRNAKHDFLKKYTHKTNFSSLVKIYRETIKNY